MGTRTILLLRHGDYEASGIGVLTPVGRDQASATAKFLADLDFDAIWSSTLPRARETAALVVSERTEKVRLTRLLREGMYTKVKGYPVPASERREDRVRAEAAYSKFFRTSRTNRTELFVCHGNLIRYFVCRALNVPISKWLRMTTNHCSLTRILIRDSGAVRVVSYNETGHLPQSLVT